MNLKKFRTFQKFFDEYLEVSDTTNAENKIQELDREISKEAFWKDQVKSKKIIKEKNLIDSILSFYKQSKKNLINLEDLNKLALEENDTDTIKDCSEKILQILKEIRKFEIKCFLSGENDQLDIYMEIHGAGVLKVRIGPKC